MCLIILFLECQELKAWELWKKCLLLNSLVDSVNFLTLGTRIVKDRSKKPEDFLTLSTMILKDRNKETEDIMT